MQKGRIANGRCYQINKKRKEKRANVTLLFFITVVCTHAHTHTYAVISFLFLLGWRSLQPLCDLIKTCEIECQRRMKGRERVDVSHCVPIGRRKITTTKRKNETKVPWA